MSVNLLDLVQGQFTGPLLSQLGATIGADEKAVSGALDGAIPTMLAGLLKQGSAPGGADALSSQLDGLDIGFLDNLGGLFKGGDKGLADLGGGLLGGLLGGKLGSVTDILGKLSGLGGGKMGSLLKMLAPVIFGVLAKQKKLLGLGAKGLLDLLLSQKKLLAGLLPAGIGDALGVTKLMSDTPDPVAAVESAAEKGGRWIGKLVPLAVLVVAGWFVYTRYIAPSGATLAGDAVLETGEVTQELGGVLDSVTSQLGSIHDRASALAAVPALEHATENLGAIGESLEALPAVAQGPVRQLVDAFLPKAEGLLDSAMNLGGVGDALEPVAGPLLDQLRALAN